ncbi:MAG: GGDEF domain-containing protein [Betaproteobacteria bacterium]|nr:GGDEF domain-containing protein [Betaproteobacteria bacterium]
MTTESRLLTAQVPSTRWYRIRTTDELTGIRNRRAFLEAGALEVARAMRHSRPLAVMFLDLDDFKKLNDTMGHGAGDEALEVTAATLGDVMRSSDLVARIGGDEFAILLSETGNDVATGAARRLSIALRDALRRFPPVTVSIGLACFEEADRPFPEMLKVADELMYESKQRGRGGLEVRNGLRGSFGRSRGRPRRQPDEAGQA